MINKVDILKRRNQGKDKLNQYKNLFGKFTNAIYIDLEKTDKILNDLSFSKISNQIVKENVGIQNSILMSFLKDIGDFEKSYIFTDDFEHCGAFLVNTKEAIEKSLIMAKKDYNHTFFILDKNKKFFIRVNYYENSHNDYPLMYDINLSW